MTLEVKGVTAQNRIIVISGANLSVSPGDIAFLKETIGRYDMPPKSETLVYPSATSFFAA